MVYSDEDKTDGEMRTFFEPNKKDDFNLDLLLSNNYICHFTIIKSELMKALKFRPEFDGAQDHDIFLRVVQYCLIQDNLKKDHFDVLQKRIGHVSRVLYHWRCHTSSTAENPASKLYAYEAGGRAIEDFCKKAGWQVTVQPTDHLGFFRVNYELGLMRERGRVGAIGGPIISQGKIVSGALKKDGTPIYYGLNKHYSGYMHKAILMQEVDALDLANIRVREEVKDIFIECLKLFSVDIKSKKGEDFQNRKSASLEFARRLHEKGYCMVYDPQMVK